MDGPVALLVAAPILFLASWVGGRLQPVLAGTHLRAQTMLSFVGGLMLGMGVLHLLPHAVLELGNLDRAVWAMLAGVLTIFLLMRFLHVHSHDPGVATVETPIDRHEHGHHHHEAQCSHSEQNAAPLRWWTLLSGLTLHSIVDGMAVAAAMQVEAGHGFLPGLAVLVVVLFHKPIDAMALASTVASCGESADLRRLINAGFALITPIAAVAAFFGLSVLGQGNASAPIAGYVLAFSAGAFVCVALADLMPEVQFHTHHRARLTAALLVGVGVSVLLGVAEGSGHGHASGGPGHSHAH
ncbi:MAG: ZIP family metal transporter [Phycisphaerales bacterium]